MIKHNLDFKRGELVATARHVLNLYHQDAKTAITNSAVHELERLIGNMFGLREPTGSTIQLCALILAIAGEEHVMAPTNR